MKDFFNCCLYLIAIGIIGFFAGRHIPQRWLQYDKWPYRAFDFESDGKIYDILRVREWKDKLPDMSVILPEILPVKRLSGQSGELSHDRIMLMIRETCIAELVHVALCLLGLHCIRIWLGIGGLCIALLNVIGNLPYIIVQRYNRRRFVHLLSVAEKRFAGREYC